MTDVSEPRAKRQKKDKGGRFAALEKLKALKEKGVKNKYDVSEVQNVYDTIDEKEYTKKVLSRQEDDWIVDDDGSGYIEDGRDIFDDDLDAESIAAAKAMDKTSKKKKRKAVSATASKGNLHMMLSNMPTKKKEDAKLEDDDVLSELISQIDEPDASNSSEITGNANKRFKLSQPHSVLSEKRAAQNYVKSFTIPKPKQPLTFRTEKENTEPRETPACSKALDEIASDEPSDRNSTTKSIEDADIQNEPVIESNSMIDQSAFEEREENKLDDITADLFDDDFTIPLSESFAESNSEIKNNCSVSSTGDYLNGWESMQDAEASLKHSHVDCSVKDIPLIENESGNKVFRFFWWDAYEDFKANVYLFGKTFCKSTKSHVSCCVVVRNINRRIYLLPRAHHLNASGQETDQPVSLMDVYTEFTNDVAAALNLKTFKSRKVTKSYAFDPNIPVESEYLEVQYPSNVPAIPSDLLQGKTYSWIFGVNSSFLEIFLLDRKIKGPCWLDVANPEPVSNPVSWCTFEINCTQINNVKLMQADNLPPPPPMVIAAVNLRTAINKDTMKNEIVMVSCLVHTKYCVNKQAPNPPCEEHFCVFTKPGGSVFPVDIFDALGKFKATKVQKLDSERALLNHLMLRFSKIDPDLVVGHDLQSYQIGILSERIIKMQITSASKLSKLKSSLPQKVDKLERSLFLGRLVCDLKVSAKELIKSRSFDLNTLCQTVLKMSENQRVDLEVEDIPKMFNTSHDILKLISLTMQDTLYILRMLYDLNVIPLALQITNIAGNVMSKTLMGGRSERNEFLLLHAFSEKDYIVPDKRRPKENTAESNKSGGKKKPAYAGGLVLDPKVGFYDTLILLMDFNSLYPSIIQEYNICFTTIPVTNSEENVVLPDKHLSLGILPTEIRKLVESRRQVKQLMKASNISEDMYMQYNIRQMALKLTANSMYGCLGFANSRFYAKNLAALVTLKGREILVNTKEMVQKMNYEVIYGDTDSIMINTQLLEYDQVFQVGSKIKHEVNKLYKNVELDIDGVFKYLLLLKKKKYAAVTLSKTKTGQLKTEMEMKGLDIVRRDWSQLATEAGKIILQHIFSDQSADDRLNSIHLHLEKLKDDLENDRVPLSLLVVTKQLTKDPHLYENKTMVPHVQVALRYNQKGGKPLRAGDTVSYVICDDGSTNSATQRAYHVDELKNSKSLKIDVKYYLSQQIHPVVSRLCEPIEGIDDQQIAISLGLDPNSYKKSKPQESAVVGENIKRPEIRYENVEPFEFTCMACNAQNSIKSPFSQNSRPFLEKCSNDDCRVRPVDYIKQLQNQLILACRNYIHKYYRYEMMCEDPACPYTTTRVPQRFAGTYPVCPLCESAVMYKKYTEKELWLQLDYFHYLFNMEKHPKKPLMEQQVAEGLILLMETVNKFLSQSGYQTVNLADLFRFALKF